MKTKRQAHHLRHIVAVSNNKGGAGKTSTVLNLGAAIAQRLEGYRVLVIDIDPQRNLSYFLGWDDRCELDGLPTVFNALSNDTQGLPVYPTTRTNLFLCPSSVKLNGIDAILSMRPNPSMALNEVLSRPIDYHPKASSIDTGPQPAFIADFDFVFIDTQPAMSRMTYNALYAADAYIIPTELEEASVKGMANLAVAAGKVERETGRLSIHGILITKYDAKLRSAKLYEQQIRASFRETFRTAVRRSKDIIESQALREDVFASYPNGRAAEDYTQLANEYLSKYAND